MHVQRIPFSFKGVHSGTVPPFRPLAADYTLKAHSAYLKLLTADVNAARGIVMDYGDGETTGIATITNDRESMADDAWYTVDGKKLDEKPVKKGLYIHNGRKTVIK